MLFVFTEMALTLRDYLESADRRFDSSQRWQAHFWCDDVDLFWSRYNAKEWYDVEA